MEPPTHLFRLCLLTTLLLLTSAHPVFQVPINPLPSIKNPSHRTNQRLPQSHSLHKRLRGLTARTESPALLPGLRDDAVVSLRASPSGAVNIHDIAEHASPIPVTYPTNYTLDFCTKQYHCHGIGTCLFVSDTEFFECEKNAPNAKPDDICFCYPLGADPLCESSSDCVPEEFCVLPKGIKYQLCISRNYESVPHIFKPVDDPTQDEEEKPVSKPASKDDEEASEQPEKPEEPEKPKEPQEPEKPQGSQEPESNPASKDDEEMSEESEERTCVEALALGHMSPQELVYEKHMMAHVLCDVNGSCATPGHIIVFNEAPMMMRTYCELLGGCEKKISKVNSPRYRKAMRVPSRTEGLEYTAFASRYGTVAEEAVIRFAVHVGL